MFARFVKPSARVVRNTRCFSASGAASHKGDVVFASLMWMTFVGTAAIASNQTATRIAVAAPNSWDHKW